MTILRRILLQLLLGLVSQGVWAIGPSEILADPTLEARARALSSQLRCMVCQNQSIDDSDAALARDIRLVVREHIQAGESDEGIKAYLVQRYGDFILLKPPLKTGTMLLWGGPAVVLLVGGLAAAMAARHARISARNRISGPLTESEKAKLEAVLRRDSAV